MTIFCIELNFKHMKSTILFTIFILFYSCKQNSNKVEDKINIKIDTLQVNNNLLIRKLKDNRFNSLLSFNGDTIIKSQDYYSSITFLDINKDSYKDIRVNAFSNTPNQCDNYFYDRKSKTFNLIKNCYLDINKIKGTEFYFSYNKLGCSDLNWESYLSKIEGFKLVNYGYMNGQGCDVEIKENPQIIEIYKVLDENDKNNKLLEKLPYLKQISKNDDKFNFIEKYWKQNCKKFESSRL